jgi:hypothetical protein
MNLKKSNYCLNCKASIGDANYCSNCGQLNTDKRLPVKHFLKDLFGDVFTFDSKFFRSIFPLVLKPGHLTNEYLTGRRANYIYPIRLYIFTTFLFFFVVTINTKIDQQNFDEEESSAKASFSADSMEVILNKYNVFIPEGVKDQIKNDLDSSLVSQKNDSNIKFDFGNSDSKNSLSQYLNKKAKYLTNMGKEGGTLFWKEMINQIPKVLFILLPMFALFLKILYIRRKILYIEHLIFSLHIHTFIFLYLLLALLLPYWYIILTIILGIFLHLFLSMKNVYQQSIFKTFVKMHLLLFLYFILIIPAFALLALLAMVSV